MTPKANAPVLEKLANEYVRTPRLTKRRHQQGDHRIEDQLDAAKDATQDDRIGAHRMADRIRAAAALGGDKIGFAWGNRACLSRSERKFLRTVDVLVRRKLDLEHDQRRRLDLIVARIVSGRFAT
jgi:hypothetical protein